MRSSSPTTRVRSRAAGSAPSRSRSPRSAPGPRSASPA
jgi:hypothetical protein